MDLAHYEHRKSDTLCELMLFGVTLSCSDQGYKIEFQGRNFSSLSIDFEFV
jgi:hypothetical protein